MKRSALTLAALCLLVFAESVLGASGDRDRSYGTNGSLSLSQSGSFTDYTTPVVYGLLADDKLITAGGAQGNQVMLLRFLKNGASDVSFGTQGRVLTPIGSLKDYPQKILLYPDGRFLVAGYHLGLFEGGPGGGFFYYEFFVVRYLANGTLDTTFRGTGKFVNGIAGEVGSRAYDAALQPDGKLVIAGIVDGTNKLVLVRLNADGSFDTTLDNDGILVSDTSSIPAGTAVVAVQTDGKILVGGIRNTGSDRYVIERYTTTGVLDSTFNGGRITFGAGVATLSDYLLKLTALPDGKILALGTSERGAASPGNFAITLTRFNSTGMLDPTFDGDGQVVSSVANDGTQAYAFTLHPDGRILAEGSIMEAGVAKSAIIRYRPDGSLDTQFGKNGVVVQPSYQQYTSGLIQSDGKLVFSALGPSDNPDYPFSYLARYLDNGSREADFDRDKSSDVSVFRPSAGTWYLNNSTSGFASVTFGQAGDRVAPADFDGDGQTDVTVFRAGVWYLLRSSDHAFVAQTFGLAGDVPVPADYDGDGRADLAVYRQGIWYVLNSRDGSLRGEQFGQAGDRPVVGNFDGDLRADLAVYRDGIWFVNGSTGGFTAAQFGLASDRPVAADYDSDGKTDYAVYRDGTWYLLQSFAGFNAIPFGVPTDRPVPADYDGDGQAEAAVYRDGAWYILGSTSGFRAVSFGVAEDVPVPSAFLP